MLRKDDRIILIKILPERFLQDFLDGNLYFNTANYFTSIDSSDFVRFDPHEAIRESWQVLDVAIADPDGNWVPISGVQNPVILRDASFNDLNIFCTYGLTERADKPFDARNLAFGDKAVIVRDLMQFVERIRTAAALESKKLQSGPIQYVERNDYHGDMGPFRKFSELSYQNEFRFVLNRGNGSACRLNIGDIRDITIVIESPELVRLRG